MLLITVGTCSTVFSSSYLYEYSVYECVQYSIGTLTLLNIVVMHVNIVLKNIKKHTNNYDVRTQLVNNEQKHYVSYISNEIFEFVRGKIRKEIFYSLYVLN